MRGVPKRKKSANCSICKRPIRTMVWKGTGVCSENCKDERDGKVEHPTTMPRPEPMGYKRPKSETDNELTGILMDGTEGGVDPGSIS